MRGSFISRGGWWVLTQSILMLAVLALGPLGKNVSDSRVGFWTGMALIVVGAYFGIAGTMALGRNRTIYPLPLPDGELVQDGIYRRMRHPLYASLIFLGAGWALVWASGPAAFAELAMIVFLDRKARCEEEWLAAKFLNYREYAARVRRFVPGIY
jgi:protein-S-isoprenylcysteine O-methyltransferase Ste14